MPKKRAIRWLIIIICFYLIITTIRAMVDLWKSGDKVTRREQELASLEKEQEELLKQKRIVESPQYLEKIARNQLGLSKSGEEVIIVPEDLLLEAPVASPDATPNWQKWMRLWF